MFDFSTGITTAAIAKLKALLAEGPTISRRNWRSAWRIIAKAITRTAIAEGHKAEKLKPKEQLVHTNLSLFYMKAGDKRPRSITACRRASRRGAEKPPRDPARRDPELQMAQPKPPPVKLPEKFPDMPWKKKLNAAPASSPSPDKTGDAAAEHERVHSCG